MSHKTKKWSVEPQINKNKIDAEHHWIISQVLTNRKVDKKDWECFLNPDYEKCAFDPFLFRDMHKAVDLAIKHIVARNKIMIYGDYDADGVTAAAIMAETLSTLKGDVDIYIPDRVKEGYGLNKKAVKSIIEKGFKLIITVDGGIRSAEEVKYAQDKGVDVIVTDHHVAPRNKKEIPNCLILNSILPKEKYPFKLLVGAGVAFKFAKAIISKTKLSEADKKTLEHRILDLAAIGTITDRFPLLGENRILANEGLKIINRKSPRVGLQELIKIAGLDNREEKIDSYNIGFQLGPRINAAGRMGSANTAFDLLIARDPKEAQAIAERLNKKNIERQEETADIAEKVEKQINLQKNIIIGICEEGDAWNEGIIGLVAGKIAEKYYKPTLIIARTEDGYKGSGRGIKEFDLVELLEACGDLLGKYGGHTMACGFSLDKEKIKEFKKRAEEFSDKKLKGLELVPQIMIDAEVELDELSEDLVKEIAKLEPFGQDNEKPILASRDVIIGDILRIGLNGDHLKLKLTNGRSMLISAIGFGIAKDFTHLAIGDRVDIAYYLELNNFNGHREIQMRIVDIKKT